MKCLYKECTFAVLSFDTKKVIGLFEWPNGKATLFILMLVLKLTETSPPSIFACVKKVTSKKRYCIYPCNSSSLKLMFGIKLPESIFGGHVPDIFDAIFTISQSKLVETNAHFSR